MSQERAAGEGSELTIERRYRARVEDVWDLWTTKEGFESWWGPQGFRVEVRALDAREGGTLEYEMIADTPEMNAAMTRMGQPVSHGGPAGFQGLENNGRLVTTSTAADYQVLADSIYTMKATVADDAATSFLVDANASRNLGWQVFVNNSGFKGSGHCQVTASVFCTLDADSVGMAATTGVLSGTTGADGVVTVSAATDGRFYIENRSAASRSITLIFTGQSTS